MPVNRITATPLDAAFEVHSREPGKGPAVYGWAVKAVMTVIDGRRGH